ncbi:MAG TPA: sigma-70 family RNA polymerase sigma factor, partial [Steroidobacteraceae bacterium]|nr:sigma-70 family RNA polymerase sigma factor [Steroidobacteraceae bacterium]
NITPDQPVPLIDTPKPGAGGPSLAVDQLFASLRPELLRFAWWLARDRAVAEDVVQEALLRAWRSRDALKDPAAARGWLLTIVRREHARLYERKRLEITDLDEVIAAEDSQLAIEGEELVGLRLAITQLPEEYRVPLVMQVLGGFTTDEIARELTLSTAAVLTRLFRARNRLRRIYGLMPAPDGMDEPAV